MGNVSWVMYALFGLCAVALVVAVSDRRLRRRLLLRLAVLLVLLAALAWLGERLRHPEGMPVAEEPGPPAVVPFPSGVGPSGDADLAPPGRTPDWIAYLGSAALAGAVAWWIFKHRRKPAPGDADEVREALAEASAGLAAGQPVSDVVIRCWTRMVAVVSQRTRGVDRPAVTPREIAAELARLGLGEDAVLVLTRLFEEVRYGHKDSESRRAAALEALAAIERAYG